MPRDVKLPESGNTRSDKTSIKDRPLPALDRARTGRAPAHGKALCQGIVRIKVFGWADWPKVYLFADRESGPAEALRGVSEADQKHRRLQLHRECASWKKRGANVNRALMHLLHGVGLT